MGFCCRLLVVASRHCRIVESIKEQVLVSDDEGWWLLDKCCDGCRNVTVTSVVRASSLLWTSSCEPATFQPDTELGTHTNLRIGACHPRI